MEQYYIHHRRKLGDLDSYLDYVGHVEADSLEHAYTLSQNLEETWNKNEPCRSTSIGDVIRFKNDLFLVHDFGFKKLNFTEILQTPPKYENRLE